MKRSSLQILAESIMFGLATSYLRHFDPESHFNLSELLQLTLLVSLWFLFTKYFLDPRRKV